MQANSRKEVTVQKDDHPEGTETSDEEAIRVYREWRSRYFARTTVYGRPREQEGKGGDARLALTG